MLIDLQSIDEDGKNFNFNELSEELFGAFKDLIGKSAFNIELSISPLGNTYQMTGSVSSEYSEVCSRCGYDIDVPFKSKINEIVVIEKERPRNTQVSQSKQNLDATAPAVTYINESSFDLKEFLHEMMATGFEIYPRCTDETVCKSRQIPGVIENETTNKVGHKGFAALKNFKAEKH